METLEFSHRLIKLSKEEQDKEILKLAKIGKIANLLAEACEENNSTLEDLLPLITALTKRKLN